MVSVVVCYLSGTDLTGKEAGFSSDVHTVYSSHSKIVSNLFSEMLKTILGKKLEV